VVNGRSSRSAKQDRRRADINVRQGGPAGAPLAVKLFTRRDELALCLRKPLTLADFVIYPSIKVAKGIDANYRD
jgi:hypothetical protein